MDDILSTITSFFFWLHAEDAGRQISSFQQLLNRFTSCRVEVSKLMVGGWMGIPNLVQLIWNEHIREWGIKSYTWLRGFLLTIVLLTIYECFKILKSMWGPTRSHKLISETYNNLHVKFWGRGSMQVVEIIDLKKSICTISWCSYWGYVMALWKRDGCVFCMWVKKSWNCEFL